MNRNIFDSHAHYTDKAFNDDRENMLGSLRESGICGVINCGADIESSVFSVELANKYDYIYAACGIHPEEADKIPENYIEILKNLARNEKCVAIGEIGLDYYWRQDNKEKQKELFENQILLSKELDLPIIVHDREAHGDTLEILKKHKPKGVLHCFSGSPETAEEILKLGMYIGLGGALTFKNARKAVEVAEMLPLDRLLLETDCPYMAPVPFRGKRNYSGYIPYIAEKVAEIKGIDPQTVLDITSENAKKLFDLK
ncbi:MAG: TatD family deoxyribonuclease [Ruminococcaceae bacterium]|nr:TatD family deoxyribonuclease [Oscillospiraceae bacterium]